ncbi:MAG: hypothetical protein E6899_11445, partial [Neisseria sp.]|nr:hypothetical protein [Neisseria sp.]
MDGVLVRITGGRLKICIGGITASDTLSDAFVSCWVSDDGLQWFKYSGLTLNQDKATKPQTVQIVRQGEATPYWFKV